MLPVKSICASGCGNGRCTSPNKCTCHSGYHGDRCQYDINECYSRPCDQNCRNLPGTYACTCRAGFTKTNPRNPTDRSCTDVNECSASPCSCSNSVSSCRASCRNTIGSYSCSCNSGFQLNSAVKTICVDIDECSSSTLHKCHHLCYNTPGSFFCKCRAGFRLSSDSKTCTDIDECKSLNGGCGHICTNQVGSFQCSCRNGYELLYDKKRCGDINECFVQTPCDLSKSMCHNYPGSYQCVCKTGYRILPNNRTCIDINECTTTVEICQHQCTNSEGSYSCSCKAGYQLNEDKHKCDDIDECKLESHRCDHKCQNTIGSYTCSCRNGYTLNADGFTCQALPCIRISKPAFGIINCTGFVTDSVCNFSCSLGFELQGSSRRVCLSSTTWSGHKVSCKRKTCPTLLQPTHGSIIIPCFQLFGSTCIKRCQDGYYLEGNRTTKCVSNEKNMVSWNNKDTYCKVITPCQPNPCHHNGECTQLSKVEYSCNCDGTGFVGKYCQIAMVIVSEPPPVFVGIESEPIIITTRAEKSIEIKFHEKTGLLRFLPNPVVLKYPKLQAKFKIKSNHSGVYRVKYSINSNDLPLLPLPDDVVHVFQASVPEPVKIESDIFKQGCQQQELLGNVSLSSTCEWNNNGTSGLVTVSAPFISNIPFSMNGLAKETFDTLSHNGTMEPVGEILQLLEQNKFATCPKQCNSSVNGKRKIDFLIGNYYFPKYVFKALENLLPNWFSIAFSEKEHKYDLENLHSKIVKANKLESYPPCKKLHYIEDTGDQYIVYTPKMFMEFQFQSSIQKVSDLTATCFYVNLNKGIVSVNVDKGLDIFNDFATLGLPISRFTVTSLAFTPSVHKIKQCVFTGAKQFCIHPVMKINSRITSTFHMNKFTFNGSISLETYNLNELLPKKLDAAFKCLYSGSFNYEMKLNFLGKTLKLKGMDQYLDGSMHRSDSLGYWDITMNPILTASSFLYDYSTITFQPFNNSFLKMSLKGNGGMVTGIGDVLKTILILRTYQRYFLTYTSALENGLKVKHGDLAKIVASLKESVEFPLNALVQEFIGKNSNYHKIIKLFKRVKENLFNIEAFASTLKYWLKSKQISEFDQNITFILHYTAGIKAIQIIPTLSPVTFYQKDIIISYFGKICLYNLCLDDMLVRLQYEINGGRVIIVSTFTTARNLSARLRVKKGDMLYLSISKQKHQFYGYMNISIKMFKDFYDTVLNITELQLSFKFRAQLSTKYQFDVFGHSNLQDVLSWKNVIQEIRGESSTMSHHLNTVMQRNFEKIAKDTNKRLHLSRQRLSGVRAKLNSLKETQIIRKTQYENASAEYRRAYALYQHTIIQLNTSQQEMESYTYIKRLYIEKNLSGICPIQTCKQKCLYVPVCKICQDKVFRIVNYLKCDQTEENVRTVIDKSCPSTCDLVKHIFIPRYTGTCRQDPREQAVIDAVLNKAISVVTTKAGKVIGSIFGPIGGVIGGFIGKAIGYIVGMFVSCSRTYEVTTKKIPYSQPCLLPCKTTEVLTRKISTCYNKQANVQGRSNVTRQCNCVRSCVSKVAEVTCTLNNYNCIKKRQLFLKMSDKIPKKFADLYESIEKQKTNVAALRTRSRSLLRSREFFKEELKKSNITLSNAQHEQKLIKRKDLSATAILSHEICIMAMFNRHPNLSNVIHASSPVTFNGTLPFLQNILLRLDFADKVQNKTTEFVFVYSFDDAELSLKTAMKNILVKSFCKSRRKRRSVDVEQIKEKGYIKSWFGNETNEAPMQKACVQLKHTSDLVRYALLSLQNLTKDALELKAMVNATERSLQFNKMETKKDVLNAQHETISSLKYEVSIYRNKTTVFYVLSQWKENMEFYRSEQNISFCLAFVDCLVSSVSDLINLPSNFNNKDKFYRTLSNITNSIAELGREENVDTYTLEFLFLETTKLMEGIDTILKESFHCKALPKLISVNTTYYDVENGSSITLVCGTVQSELSVLYTWKHNEKIIDEETKNALTMIVKLSDRGNYVCEVRSKVGTVSSNATYINVYEKPKFIEDLTDLMLFLPNIRNVSSTLVCNVSAFPTPSYKWFFQTFDMLKAPIELEAKSIAYSIPDVNATHSGYYYCKASNEFGEVTSSFTRLDVLEIQYPNFVLEIGVNVSDIVFANASVDLKTVNSSYFAPILNKMSISDCQNITATFNESRLSITMSSFAKEIIFNKTMEDVFDFNVKSRQDLSLSAAVFLQQISNSSIVFINDNSSYFSIVEDSLSVNVRFNICQRGYKIHENGLTCVQCPAGTYANDEGVCVACKEDHYQDLPGQTYCNKCYLQRTDKTKNNMSRHYCEKREGKVAVEAHEQDYTSIILGSTAFCLVFVVLFIILYVYKKKRSFKKYVVRSTYKTLEMDEPCSREPCQRLLYIRDNPTYQACRHDETSVVNSSQDCTTDGETKQAIIKLQRY
ncbi:uncharacterized protein LOC130642139 isoform X2 [Hydractinia symbiolongicarpus]|uniref:uncharacterized protein LOC130642139 isoform X2 n=1 Tax=Hydractinia symbiolongicarpus TaxID=13093 RepID=UPI00254E9EAC|nr:uncharacterized protein LOC130642139 isoform X2 [Hydractinia symbiolongicarpus]